MALLEYVRVVVRQLLTGRDVANRLDPYAAIIYHGIAIWITRVIDEPCFVPINCSIDHNVIVDRKEIRVMPLVVVRVSFVSLLWSKPLAAILDETCTTTNGLGRKRAEPLNARWSYLKREQVSA